MVIPLARRVEVAGLDLNVTAIVQRGLGVLLILIGAVIVYRIGKTVIARSAKPKYDRSPTIQTRAEETRGLLLSVWKYVVVLGVLVGLLALLPATLAQAVTVAAIGGVILALAANALFKDIVAGFSILLEGQLAVGDRVRLFGVDVEGVVEGVGLRITVLKEDDGSRVFVSNGSITAIRALSGEVAGKAEEEKRPRGTRGGRTRTRTPRPRRAPEKPAAETAAPKPEERAADKPSAPKAPLTQETPSPVFEVRGPTARASAPEAASEAEDEPTPSRGPSGSRSRRGGRRRGGGTRRPPRTGTESRAAEGDEPAPKDEEPRETESSQRPRQPPQKTDTDQDDVLTESPWSIE